MLERGYLGNTIMVEKGCNGYTVCVHINFTKEEAEYL
jgi:hypothetical protein